MEETKAKTRAEDEGGGYSEAAQTTAAKPFVTQEI